MSAPPLHLAAVLFPGFELLDAFGPLEMFGLLPEHFALQLLAEQAGAVASAQGPAAVAEASFATAPPCDILLVPGGPGARREIGNATLLQFLRERAREARYVASVCTGSALLARAGVLDGRRATSNKLSLDWAMAQGPAVQWQAHARWVEDGPFFTSSGVSAGIDMALALIERVRGREYAERAARCAEYVRHHDPHDDPFAAHGSDPR